MRKGKLLYSAILTGSIALIVYTFMLPIYIYTSELMIRQIDQRAVVIQKLIHGFLISVLVIAIRTLWTTNSWFKFAYIVLLTFVCYRLALFCKF